MKERAKLYFLLADQYLETTFLLLKTIIESGNDNSGVGNSEEEAYKNMKNNIIKSDAYLFIPSLFNSIQSVELFLKGLLLLNNVEVSYSHEVSELLIELKKIYGEKLDICKSFNDFYNNQMDILKEYKNKNKITTTKELYESLRYPENNNKEYEYFYLKYNGNIVINQYKKILRQLENIKNVVLKEFRNN